MTRIVHLTSVHPPFDGRIFLKECRSLARLGYDTTLVAPHPKDEVVDGVRVLGVAEASGGRLRRMTETAARVVRAARALDADLYHLHDPELLPWAPLLRGRGRPVVFDMHENLPRQIQTKAWIPPRLRMPLSLVGRGVERLLHRRLGVIFAEASYRKDYRHLPLTLDLLNLPLIADLSGLPRERSKRPSVGYVGGVTEARGTLVTLEALALLDQDGEAPDFDCIGPVSEAHRAEIEANRTRLGLRHVEVPGRLPAPEAWARVARSHVGLCVLQPLPNYIETYPTKLFEYLALGIPVVASNFPSFQKLVDETGGGLCVDPRDPAAIASAIKQLLDDPEAAWAMGQRGAAAVRERYSWESQAPALAQFYEGLLR